MKVFPIGRCSVALAVTLAACSPESPPGAAARRASAPDPGSASLVLVTLDTYRAEATGIGGSADAHTPWLDRLARTGIEFETGVSATPLTAPSHTSILTGLDPPAHGVRDNGSFRLSPDVPTIASALRERGFATGGFIAAFPVLARFGLAEGFDVYDEGDVAPATGPTPDFRLPERPGDEVANAALAWMEEVPASRRLFAWIHFFDAHAPYDAATAWVRAAGGDVYRGDVAWTDDCLGRIVQALEVSARPCWLLVQGDHGESQGDHGEDSHSLFVYDATIRVPAVLWPAPREERPGLRRATFRNVDVPATAFELLGLEPRQAPGSGVSVLTEEAGPAYIESLYPLLHYGWSDLRGIRDGRWKYIESTEPELFDLEADPGERRNLFEDRPDVVARLAAVLEERMREETSAAEVELDEAEREALESLGYVTERVEASGEALPDPKRMLHVQRYLYLAMNQIPAGLYSEAMRSLQAALSRDPRNKDVHKMMGVLHAAEGRDALAIDSFRRCIELPPPGDDDARLKMASAYLRLGQYDESAYHFEIVANNDPENANSWYNLGTARMAQGRPAAAKRAWLRGLELDPEHELIREALRKWAKDLPQDP